MDSNSTDALNTDRLMVNSSLAKWNIPVRLRISVAGVAQRIERQTFNLVVVGWSPTIGPRGCSVNGNTSLLQSETIGSNPIDSIFGCFEHSSLM